MLNGFAVGYFWKHTDISDCFHLFNLMSVQVLSYHGTVTAEDVVKLKVHTPLSTEVHLQTEVYQAFSPLYLLAMPVNTNDQNDLKHEGMKTCFDKTLTDISI